jgi:hypothetical protein
MARMVSLRRHRDVISLVASWALLLQALIGPVLPSLHMTADEGVVMCTAKGAVARKEAPAPKQHKPNCQCCTLACRVGCTNASFGLLPDSTFVPAPASAAILIVGPHFDAPAPDHAEFSAARPRGPPVA